MSGSLTAPPVLSTPESSLFHQSVGPVEGTDATQDRISDEQLYIQYEIRRTVQEIRDNGWKRVALQFPDGMLRDAPRISEHLRWLLRRTTSAAEDQAEAKSEVDASLAQGQEHTQAAQAHQDAAVNGKSQNALQETDTKLTILADTSYGACCVDEIAAEHVDAEAVVHYGRSCLSPTARLPVVYVFTSRPLDIDKVVQTFKATYSQLSDKICLLADVPYAHHISVLASKLRSEGYTNVYPTEILHDPPSLLPNRSTPPDVRDDPESLKDYSIFHISQPPTSLLLTLTSRVRGIYIYPTDPPPSNTTALVAAVTTPLLRRRYALVTQVPSIAVIGILINTLSVRNYMSALSSIQKLIMDAGKKFYTFVVGKLNPAKLANFAEVGLWVVIGCWESSLIDGKDFYAPVLTPFELEVGLQGDANREWGGQWLGGFESMIYRPQNGDHKSDDQRAGKAPANDKLADHAAEPNLQSAVGQSWQDEASDDEPPDFDLRTGRYVSNTRPMPRTTTTSYTSRPAGTAPPSSALVQRPKSDLATVNGSLSPGAEFLRSKRTWQGLGSDLEVGYERDEDGKIQGAGMEEGRSGLARGYAVGELKADRT